MRRGGVLSAAFPWQAMKEALGKRDSRSQRIAYYLDWAAQTRKGQYEPYNEIAKAIDNRSSLPRMDSDHVKGVRRSIGAVRAVLQKRYQRDLDSAVGSMRATVDDEDTASVALPKRMKRLRSAKNSLVATHQLIDPSKVKDARIKAYLQHDVRDIIKLVSSPDFDKKLLPPVTADADK